MPKESIQPSMLTPEGKLNTELVAQLVNQNIQAQIKANKKRDLDSVQRQERAKEEAEERSANHGA